MNNETATKEKNTSAPQMEFFPSCQFTFSVEEDCVSGRAGGTLVINPGASRDEIEQALAVLQLQVP